MWFKEPAVRKPQDYLAVKKALPTVKISANAHLMAASPNRFLLEMNMTPDPLKEGVLKDGPVVKNGYFDLPDKPGLGVELKEGLEEMYPPLPGAFIVCGVLLEPEPRIAAIISPRKDVGANAQETIPGNARSRLRTVAAGARCAAKRKQTAWQVRPPEHSFHPHR